MRLLSVMELFIASDGGTLLSWRSRCARQRGFTLKRHRLWAIKVPATKVEIVEVGDYKIALHVPRDKDKLLEDYIEVIAIMGSVFGFSVAGCLRVTLPAPFRRSGISKIGLGMKANERRTGQTFGLPRWYFRMRYSVGSPSFKDHVC